MYITIKTISGTTTGPFDLYYNSINGANLIAQNVPLTSLQVGFNVQVPSTATTVLIVNARSVCGPTAPTAVQSISLPQQPPPAPNCAIVGTAGFTTAPTPTPTPTPTQVPSPASVWAPFNLGVNVITPRFRNGDIIPIVNDPTQWSQLTTAACCDVNNDVNNRSIYGLIYNGWAVLDPRGLAPVGYHIPTNGELLQLATTYVNAGGLKEAGTAHWLNPNTGATNASGLSFLPGGYRVGIDTVTPANNGQFLGLGTLGVYFSSAINSTSTTTVLTVLQNSSANFSTLQIRPNYGGSIRLVKDSATPTPTPTATLTPTPTPTLTPTPTPVPPVLVSYCLNWGPDCFSACSV